MVVLRAPESAKAEGRGTTEVSPTKAQKINLSRVDAQVEQLGSSSGS